MTLKQFNTITFIFCLCLMFDHLSARQVYTQSTTQDQDKINRIVEVISKIPEFSTFEDAGSSYKSGDDFEEVANYFVSNSTYDEVKAFYFRRLPKKSWKFLEETDLNARELVFRKGEYSVIISFAGFGSDKKYNYAIIVRRGAGKREEGDKTKRT